MSQSDKADDWGRRFGLATSPLFEGEGIAPPGSHTVLLDGAHGTFALSVCDEELWRDGASADWTWSSDIAHHVTVTGAKVAVLRWDRPQDARVFERGSIERNLDRFYTFLTDDRLRSNRSVVDHLLGFFRRLRSLGQAAGLDDARATDIFTACLARLLTPLDEQLSPRRQGLSEDSEDLLGRLDARGLAAAIEEIERGAGAMSWLRLHPSLAVRHAGGQLFQEAHFELLRTATDFDLFGLVGAPKVAPTSRGGTHFTPPTLARSLVERALESFGDVPLRSSLTLCDPACGSGAFLHEALRALRRMDFHGHLRLVGSDISTSAIAMARFVVASALQDWAPDGGVEFDLRVGDSLGELGIPAADIVVMNPPFIGFAAQTPIQRDQLTAAIGASGRGDYSMAFIVRAMEALNAGGVLGALFPASLLSLNAASAWRERLLDLGNVRFLASIGDFGLFSHALVQVACAVLSKDAGPSDEFVALITENDPLATSAALRELRRQGPNNALPSIVGDAWSLFTVPTMALRARPTWRLPTPQAERVLQALSQAGLPTIGDAFEISQGIQTGLNEALLLTPEELHQLPLKERRYFRQATMSDSIHYGSVSKPYWVFFPHSEKGPIFPDEASIRRAMPQYFRRFLEPYRARLEGRATIVRSRRRDWWGLMHPRAWSFSERPRIITKFFGAEGAFVGDYEATYLPVMGHVWTPKPSLDANLLEEIDLLAAFVALCNSDPFVKLLSLYSPHVAGGQFDLSARHVSPVPVPDLQGLSLNPDAGRAVRELAALGRRVNLADPQWRARTAVLVEQLYGGLTIDGP